MSPLNPRSTHLGEWMPKTIWSTRASKSTKKGIRGGWSTTTCAKKVWWVSVFAHGVMDVLIYIRCDGCLKIFQILQIHLDLLHQEVSCSVLGILQALHLTLFREKIFLVHEGIELSFSIQAQQSLSVSFLTCVDLDSLSLSSTILSHSEARLESGRDCIKCHLEWRQGQRIAQLERRRGNKATWPGAILGNWERLWSKGERAT